MCLMQQISFDIEVEEVSQGSRPSNYSFQITFEKEENGEISTWVKEDHVNDQVIPNCQKNDVLLALKKHFEKVMDYREKDAKGRGHQSCDIKFSKLILIDGDTFFDEKTIKSTLGINDLTF